MPLLYLVAALIVVGIVAWLINLYVPLPVAVRTILNVVLGLMVVGMFLWLINTYVPMAGIIKAILNLVVVIATCVWILRVFGLWDDTIGLWHKFTGAMSRADRTPPPAPAPQAWKDDHSTLR